jgi:hypothetical protein
VPMMDSLPAFARPVKRFARRAFRRIARLDRLEHRKSLTDKDCHGGS